MTPQHCFGVAELFCPATKRRAQTRNTILYDWGGVIAGALSKLKHDKFLLNYLYIEFDVTGTPVNPLPTVGRGGAYQYYGNLHSSNPNRDYVRAAIEMEGFTNTDATKYVIENALRVQASIFPGATGTALVVPATAYVYGGAVVCARKPEDPGQDIIFARFYFAPAQQLSLSAGQLDCSYLLVLE